MDTIPEKAFFRIGEVSRILGVPPYVIRYWESEFKTVRPSRTSTDQRLYRRSDVQELLLIKGLLYDQRFTISGAKKQIQQTKREDAGRPPLSPTDILREIEKGLLFIRKIVT
jgi:DNA-binding transcriptional MerR regulator